MGQITLVISDVAEKLLRGKNAKKGDMGSYVSSLIMNDSLESTDGECK
jgi:hypothetical protein